LGHGRRLWAEFLACVHPVPGVGSARAPGRINCPSSFGELLKNRFRRPRDRPRIPPELPCRPPECYSRPRCKTRPSTHPALSRRHFFSGRILRERWINGPPPPREVTTPWPIVAMPSRPSSKRAWPRPCRFSDPSARGRRSTVK